MVTHVNAPGPPCQGKLLNTMRDNSELAGLGGLGIVTLVQTSFLVEWAG